MAVVTITLGAEAPKHYPKSAFGAFPKQSHETSP
jgi:hypothetical protein